jgi:hypothetical protein
MIMKKIHLFGKTGSVPTGVSLNEYGFIPTPTDADSLHNYFGETELRKKDVAIVYEGEEYERDAGHIYDFMEGCDAEVYPFDDKESALEYFHREMPEFLVVSAALPDLRDFLNAYKEMGK